MCHTPCQNGRDTAVTSGHPRAIRTASDLGALIPGREPHALALVAGFAVLFGVRLPGVTCGPILPILPRSGPAAAERQRHNRTVRSSPPLASSFPSGLNATDLTAAV